MVFPSGRVIMHTHTCVWRWRKNDIERDIQVLSVSRVCTRTQNAVDEDRVTPRGTREEYRVGKRGFIDKRRKLSRYNENFIPSRAVFARVIPGISSHALESRVTVFETRGSHSVVVRRVFDPPDTSCLTGIRQVETSLHVACLRVAPR